MAKRNRTTPYEDKLNCYTFDPDDKLSESKNYKIINTFNNNDKPYGYV